MTAEEKYLLVESLQKQEEGRCRLIRLGLTPPAKGSGINANFLRDNACRSTIPPDRASQSGCAVRPAERCCYTRSAAGGTAP
jgi:hypothetical protein